MNDLLKDYASVIEIPVAWGEMDAFQHVNNVCYFRYFETARIAYFEKFHLLDYMKETGIGPILASTSCSYKFPVTFPDTLSVGARTVKMEEDTIFMTYAAVSQRHQRVAAEGEGVVVAYDYKTKQKTAIPERIRQHIRNVERSL
jgi:acyl-CoA thioester hydrolase